MSERILVWFSCGAASAVAAKLASEKYKSNLEILYCDTLKYEHPDNVRFMKDVENWINQPIQILKSDKYTDIFDVFNKTGWLVGVKGARCTVELKINVRKAYQKPDDLHVFGLTYDEQHRIKRFEKSNPNLELDWILSNNYITKSDCYNIIKDASIELPMMYKLGYKNNNCIGCVKGQQAYWNKIRKDFPEAFDKMAEQERKMGVAINKSRKGGIRLPLFLDELPIDAGKGLIEEDIECGPQCVMPEESNLENISLKGNK